MLEIDENLRQIYKNDSLPLTEEVSYKKLILYFPTLNLTITNNQLVQGSFSLEESLCSDNDLNFGACESAQFKVTVADVEQDLTGLEFSAKQIVNDVYEMPLGTYIVDSAKKQSDKRFKDIIAYDHIKTKLNVDVAEWYNSLSFPITLKLFRKSLFQYIGLEIETQELINDEIIITKTIEPRDLKARVVAEKIGEINGCFGHITRNNKFKYIGLSGLGLYPSETLYPAEDLFPSESGETLGTVGYKKIDYEEYIVNPIDNINIRTDDEDVGHSIGIGTNTYIVQGNFLIFGMSAQELEIIGNRLFLVIKNKYYRPHKSIIPGLPYLEVGDSINIITTKDVIESFVFHRILTGIQSLTDEISATGNEYRNNNISPETQFLELRNKTLKVSKSVDALKVQLNDTAEGLQSQITQTAGSLQTQITDNKNDLQSQITQTAGSLQTQITDNKNDLQSQITQTSSSLQSQITDNKSNADSSISQLADQISLKVTKGNLSAEISLEDGDIIFSGNRLIVESSQFTLDENGKAWFGGEIAWGTGNYIKNDDNRNTVIKAMEALFLNAPAVGFGSLNRVQINGDTGSVNSTNVYANYISADSIRSGGYDVSKSNHSHSLTDLSDKLTRNITISSGGSGKIAFSNGNAVGYDYAESTYQKASDLRLKCKIQPVDDITDFYMDLVPWSFEFKAGLWKNNRNHGLFAQQIKSALEKHGIESGMVYETENHYDQGEYCKGGKHYNLRYDDLHAFHIRMIQDLKNENIKQAEEFQNTKNELSELKALLLERGVI